MFLWNSLPFSMIQQMYAFVLKKYVVILNIWDLQIQLIFFFQVIFSEQCNICLVRKKKSIKRIPLHQTHRKQNLGVRYSVTIDYLSLKFFPLWLWRGEDCDSFLVFCVGLVPTRASLVAQTIKESTCNAGDLGLIPGSGRSPGEGNDNLVPYSWRIPWTEEPGGLPSRR